MATLATCIRKAGKALNRGDTDAIRGIFNDLQADGMSSSAAADQAIGEYLDLLAAEQADITEQILDQGGVLPGDPVIRFAPDSSRTKRIAQRLNIRQVIDGTEKLDITSTTESGVFIMRDVALALQERAKAIDPGLEEQTDEARDILSTTIADEVQAAMEASGHAGHWYSDKLRNAVALVGEIHPELKTDANAQAMFLAALSITSNGQPVAKNAELAEQQYQAYKKTGSFPETGVGKERQAMVSGFRMLNDLINKKGVPATRQFLATEYTKRELMDLGYDKILSDEGTTFATHGSGIFGPKVGAGFYQNLIGNFNPLTTDRWFMRTWGRMVGKLMEDPQSSTNHGRRDRLRKALSTKKGQAKLAEMGYNKIELGNETTLADIATILHMEYARDNFENKVEWNLAAKNLDNGLNEPIAAPTGASQRNWIREVVTEARSKLAQRGTDVDTATLQALVWYPEKNLYAQHGVGDARAQPTDYEQEFARIAETKGVDPATIRGILRRETGRGPGRSERGEPEGFSAIRETLTEEQRNRELAAAGVREVRRTGRATYRGRAATGSGSLVIDGAVVTTTYKPEIFAKNQWTRTNNAAPEVHELDDTETSIKSAQAFTKSIEAAKAAHPQGAAVFVYPSTEYEGARLFLTADGKAGFALKNDDIVSVFKHPDLNAPNIVQAMVSLAVQQGGRRLDAFDTVLPYLYEQQGFKVVSRLTWDEEQAPPDWNKETFDRYNAGEPDVVFMAWDPDNYNNYTGEGKQVQSYGDAVAIQDAAVNEFSYPDLGPMRLRIEDEVAEQFGDEHPGHPISQLNKYAVTVEDQTTAAPGVAQIVKNKVTNLGDTAIEANLGLIHRNYLEDFMPDDRMSAITDYNHEIRTMDGREGELMEQYQPTAKKMFLHKVKDSKDHARLGEAMFHATINGVDPTKKYMPLKKRENMTETDKKHDALRRAEYKILKDYYDTQLSPEAKEIFVEVRDQYASLRDIREKTINERIEQSEVDEQSKRRLHLEMQKMFESGRVQGPYFPLDRWGNQYAAAYDEDGEIYAYSKFENRSDRKAWVQSMRDAGFTVQQGKTESKNYDQVKQLDPQLVSRIQGLVAGVDGAAEIQNEIYQIYLKSLPEMSMRKHFIQRKGRLGFSNDILRSYAGNMFHGVRQVARMEQQPKLEAALNKLTKQARAAEALEDAHSEWAIPLLSTMKKRHELAMMPPHSALASKATGLGFGWLLGVTPGAALLNLFQTPMFAVPTIAARKGNGAAKTSLAFAKGIAEYWTTRIGGYKSKLRGEELEAFEWAERTGIFSKTLSHDLADLINKDARAYGAWDNLMTVVSWQFHVTEQANRNVTFMVAYRLARDRGLSHDAALHDAADLNDRSHYDYAANNRPPIMQNQAAKIFLLFKNYGIHSTYQIARATKDGFFGNKDIPLERRHEARRKWIGIMTMTGLLGGLSSLPMAWAIEWAIQAALDDEDDPVDVGNEFKMYLVEDLGWSVDQANALVSGGWDALTGGTMSTRISLSYLGLAREPYKPMEGRDLQHHLMEELAGPVAGIIAGVGILGPSEIAKGISTGQDRLIERGIEKMIPKFARDLMKSVRYAREGALTYSEEPLLTPEEFTSKDLFLQAVGLTPNRLTLRYEQNRELRNMSDRLKRRRKQLMDSFFIAAQYGDPADVSGKMEAINRWNLKQPSWPIGVDELRSSAMSRQRTDLNTFGGVALEPRLDIPLRQKMTWLPVETGETPPKPPGVK